MRQGPLVKGIDGHVIVIDPSTASNGTFSPRYWIFARDSLAAKPIASDERPTDCFDHQAAVALSEELARTKLAELKGRKRPL